MNLESSRITVSFTVGGSDRSTTASRSRTPSITDTVFSPIARRTSSMTAGASPIHTAEVGRSKLSSAWPMSEMRIGVPSLVATTMSLKFAVASTRPSVRSSSCPFPCSTVPPGISTFSATMASRTSVIDRPYEFSFSMSTTTWTSRARPPDRLTWPTPLTVWMARAICLSASSVSVLRLMPGDETMSESTGSASGSTLVMTGGSSAGGALRIAPATFSRTSLEASLRSRSSTKRTVSVARPSAIRDWISSIPDTPLIASSIGSTTDDDISSGLAPGRSRVTLTVAGSAFGNRSTPRPRNEKVPRTTRDITSIVAETGRRTQNSDNMRGLPTSCSRGPLPRPRRSPRPGRRPRATRRR